MNRSVKVLYSGQSQLRFFFIAKPGRLTLNRVLPKLRTNIPIRLQGIHVGAGYAAFQMSLNVLNVYRLPAIDIARDVQVEFALLDLLDADHTRVFGNLQPLVKDIDDPVDVDVAQAVLVTVFNKPLLPSIMKMPLRVWAFSLSMTMMQAGMPVP